VLPVLCCAGRLKLGKETLATIDGHWDDRVMWKVRRPISSFFPLNKQIFSVSDPYSFFTDPDPEVGAGDQYRSGSGSNPDPIRIQGFNDQKLKKKNYS
jgi:hypothetical protein